MRVFSWLRELLRRWFGRAPALIRAANVSELPEMLAPATLYVEGEGGHVWSVAMLCPCGCGGTLHMNMLPDSQPNWKLNIHQDGSVTLHPSVWRTIGCRSHFFLRQGRIHWCP